LVAQELPATGIEYQATVRLSLKNGPNPLILEDDTCPVFNTV
jgi:hypothetical protein